MSKHVTHTVNTTNPSNVSNLFFFFVKVHLTQFFISREAPACGNKEIVSARILPHYCQLKDENGCDIARYIWNFRGSSNFLFIHSSFSRGTPENIARAPGLETLLIRDGTVVKAVRSPVRTVVYETYRSFPFAVCNLATVFAVCIHRSRYNY
jgi:hypothetical protein